MVLLFCSKIQIQFSSLFEFTRRSTPTRVVGVVVGNDRSLHYLLTLGLLELLSLSTNKTATNRTLT